MRSYTMQWEYSAGFAPEPWAGFADCTSRSGDERISVFEMANNYSHPCVYLADISDEKRLWFVHSVLTRALLHAVAIPMRLQQNYHGTVVRADGESISVICYARSLTSWLFQASPV